MKASIALLLAAFLFPVPVWAATTGAMTGTVNDDRGRPIAGAQIVATSGAQVVRGLTDARGRFTFVDLIPGSFKIDVSKKGYATGSYPAVAVAAGNERYLKLALRPQWVVTVCDCHGFYLWGSQSNAEVYIVSQWSDPFFETFQRIDLSTVPGVQPAGSAPVKF